MKKVLQKFSQFYKNLPIAKKMATTIIFILAFFVPADSLAVAFDSGGVTTGPMTVPFIIILKHQIGIWS